MRRTSIQSATYASAVMAIPTLLLTIVFASHGRVERTPSGAERKFHPRTIAEITAEDPTDWKHPLTHVVTEGWLTYKLHEGDGDWHLRLCDGRMVEGMDVKRCVVAEIIPELPLDVPKVGAHLRVWGIYRYDGENPGHHWHELHPLLRIAVLPD